LRIEDFEPVVLSEANANLVGEFRCSIAPPYTDDLTNYLRERALLEEEQNVSRTWLWITSGFRIGAYASLSAISVPTGSGALRDQLGTEKPFVPGVMLDQIAVADFVLAEKIHLGFAIFLWLRREVVLMNRRIAARLIRLDVQLGNWRAYQTYRARWRMRPLPVMVLRGSSVLQRNGTPEPVPDHHLSAPPTHLDPKTFVKLWHDVYAPFDA
jgi:hypothetical protein